MEQKRVDNLGSFVSLLIIRKFSKIVNIVYKIKLFNNIRIKWMEIHPPTTKLAKKKDQPNTQKSNHIDISV